MKMKRYSSLGTLVVFALLLITGCSQTPTTVPTTSVTTLPTEPKHTPTSFSNISGNVIERREQALNSASELESSAYIGLLEIRRYNGQNNNQSYRSWNWGSTFSHLQRLSDADYGDGIETLAGSSRKSARTVSNLVAAQNTGVTIPNTFGTSDFLWQWGQFIDHDLSLTPALSGTENLANIPVPAGDPQFDPRNEGNKVIDFHRALFDPSTGSHPNNTREQENELTSWIDGSMVYGSSLARVDALREGQHSPFLKVDSNNLLPTNEFGITNDNGPVRGDAQKNLFIAGDFRVNEQVGLAVMHTLFVREHNRLANILRAEFPNKSADEIFERARRLVIAEIQMITYNEFLPALLGNDVLPEYRGYNPSINPTIYNEFSVAAYRFGHSAISNQLARFDAEGNDIGALPIQRVFFNAPSLLKQENDLDPFLRGLAGQEHQKIDNLISNDLRNFLFGPPGAGGLDLASLNIQRGRDHGVASYNAVREAMGLTPKTSFSQISNDPAVVAALREAYTNVNDIDLWVGGLAETPHRNSQLGELFTAIVARQFTELRDGDRFWYTNDLNPEEIAFLGNVTLAQVIRNNTNIGAEIQDEVFFAATVGPRICEGDFTIGGPDIDGDIELVRNCTEITGTLRIQDTNLQDLSFLSNLRKVGAFEIARNEFLTTLQGLDNLSVIRSSLSINSNPSLTTVDNLDNLTNLDSLGLFNNDSLTTIQFPRWERARALIIVNHRLLTELNFDSLKSAGSITIAGNQSLRTINDFPNLYTIEGGLELSSNASLNSINGFENLIYIGFRLIIEGNRTLSAINGFTNVEFVGKALLIRGNPNLTSITAFKKLHGVHTTQISDNRNFDCTAYSRAFPPYFPPTESLGNKTNCFLAPPLPTLPEPF